jgi:hypothetical protein
LAEDSLSPLPFIDKRSTEVQRASGARNTPEMKLAKQAKNIIETCDTSTTHGLASVEERDSLVQNAQTTRARIEERLAKTPGAPEGKELRPLAKKLQKLEEELQSDKHFLSEKVRPSLEHADEFVNQCGAYLASPLLTIDPVLRKSYEHLDYEPQATKILGAVRAGAIEMLDHRRTQSADGICRSCS